MNPELSSLASAIASLATLVDRGGPIVLVLLALSVTALAIVLLKLQQFARLRIWSRTWLDPVLTAVRVGEAQRALSLARSSPNPIARVIECAVRARLDPSLAESVVREEVERVGRAELGSLESNLRGLETIGTLAPLLGLLGTVLGMIRAFMRLEEAGARVDPALLSGGIWEALLTTAVGLAVAIPTMAALSWLESQVDRLRRRLGDAATQVLTAPELRAGAQTAPASDTGADLGVEPQHAL